MFQDTLLIVKNDFLDNRKVLLAYLLQHGFQIQGRRRILFSPELAAEFFQDISDDPCFMFHVILLSKGYSEAFILAKENAVEDLLHALDCYFGSELDIARNVYATRCLGKVQRDISFIYPNYIFEPILCPTKKFCTDNPFVTSLVEKVYDIGANPDEDPHKSCEVKLAEWLMSSNKNLPNISNQCAANPSMNIRECAQQTKETAFRGPNALYNAMDGSKSSGLGFSTDGTSLNVTSSSCMTCSQFSSLEGCITQQRGAEATLVELVKAKTAPLHVEMSLSNVEEASENASEEMKGECLIVIGSQESSKEDVQSKANAIAEEPSHGDVNATEPKED